MADKLSYYFLTRSRTVLSMVGDTMDDFRRPAVAVAWSDMPDGPWRMMITCPVPDDPRKSAWALVSGRWANVPIEEIPY